MQLECERIVDENYYGLPVFSFGCQQWVIGTEKKFREAAKKKAVEDLWNYNAEFLCKFFRENKVFGEDFSEYDWKDFQKSLNSIQDSMSESCNPIIKTLIGSHIEKFLEAATESDNDLGLILGNYDNEIHRTDDINGLNRGYGPLCFRLD